VGSPVLAVTVGPRLNFSYLTEPVRILLRLNELEVSERNVCLNFCCLFARFDWLECDDIYLTALLAQNVTDQPRCVSWDFSREGTCIVL